MAIFQIALLEEAKTFLQGISKPIRKYCIIFGELQKERKIVNSLKNWKNLIFGSSVLFIMV